MDKLSSKLHGLKEYVKPEWRPSEFDALVALAGFILGPVVLGGLIGFLCDKDINTWYANLKKPSWTLPAPIFIAKSLLSNALKGYASWAIWTHGGFGNHKIEFGFFYAMLSLELIWPLLCFKARKLDLPLLCSITLLGLVSATITAFHPIDALAAFALIPVVVDLIFGVFHSFALYSLNPQVSKRALHKPWRAIKKLLTSERRK